MTAAGSDPFGLLERAVGYALGTVHGVTPDQLSATTPCPDWDLGTLLRHVNESLAVLGQCVDAEPVPERQDPAAAFRTHAMQLVGAISRGPCRPVVCAAGYPLATRMILATGALEIAVHGWDVARTTRQDKPIPAGLACDLLWLGPLLAADAQHHRLFAPPVAVSATAHVSDQLVALLGRDPMS